MKRLNHPRLTRTKGKTFIHTGIAKTKKDKSNRESQIVWHK